MKTSNEKPKLLMPSLFMQKSNQKLTFQNLSGIIAEASNFAGNKLLKQRHKELFDSAKNILGLEEEYRSKRFEQTGSYLSTLTDEVAKYEDLLSKTPGFISSEIQKHCELKQAEDDEKKLEQMDLKKLDSRSRQSTEAIERCRSHYKGAKKPDDLFQDSDDEGPPKLQDILPEEDDDKTIQVVLSSKNDKANLISQNNQDYETSPSFNLSFPNSNESMTSSFKNRNKTDAKSQGSGKTVRFEDEELSNPLLKKLKQQRANFLSGQKMYGKTKLTQSFFE
jgi:hypothetical protein